MKKMQASEGLLQGLGFLMVLTHEWRISSLFPGSLLRANKPRLKTQGLGRLLGVKLLCLVL